MNGETLSPQPIEIEVVGRKLKCALIGAVLRDSLREHIRKRRMDLVKQTCGAFNAELLSKVLAEVAAKPVYDSELYATLSSEEGMLYMVWRGINEYQPDIMLDWLRANLDSSGLGNAAYRQLEASGYASAEDKGEEVNPHLNFPSYDDVTERAVIIRYYHIPAMEADLLPPSHVKKLIELIPEIRRRLGE